MKSIYLSGPIAHFTYNEAEGWRDYVKTELGDEVRCLSPLRDQEYLRSAGILTSKGTEEESTCPLSMPRGITVRDRHDTMTCDLVFVNLLGAEKVSIGTMIELGWADAARVPIVMAIEDDNSNIHEHVILNELVGFKCGSLDQAILVTRSLLALESRQSDRLHFPKIPTRDDLIEKTNRIFARSAQR